MITISTTTKDEARAMHAVMISLRPLTWITVFTCSAGK